MNRQERWRATPKAIFQVATTDNRDVHLAVLSLFADRELTDPALTLELVLRALPRQAPDLDVDEAGIRRSLDQLVDWDLLDESRNEAATYRTPEEFQLRNLQWALTPNGRTAVAALDKAVEVMDAVASLQPAAIDALAQAIARVVELVDRGSSDAEIHVQWQQAEQHHQSLVDNIRQFHSQLAQLLGDVTLSEEILSKARDAIIEYLSRYIQEAERPTARVTAALERLHELGTATVLERALAGANLAPDPILGDPGPRWLEERERRLAGLDEWFLGRDGSVPQMTRIRARGRDWLLQFLRVMDLRRAQRRRSASLAGDFLALARGFASCSDPGDAHRLFVAAFELHGARHHALVREDEDPVDPATPAADNPAVALTATLRARPTTRQRTTEPPIPDRREQRARAAREQAEQLARSARMRSALVTNGVSRLSAYGRLDYEQYRDLVDLICAALALPPSSDGTRRSLSHDGQVDVVLYPLDTTETCRLVTERGVLTAPDFRLSVRLRGVDIVTGRKAHIVDAAAERASGGHP